MVVDTSALLAVLLQEEDANKYLDAMLDADRVRITAANALELGIVAINRVGANAEMEVDLLLTRIGADIVSVDHALATFARTSFRTFGKGRHSAALNFGDCFAYALAKSTSEPLLFKGNDFSQTDIKSAL